MTIGWRRPTRPLKKTFIQRSQPLKIGVFILKTMKEMQLHDYHVGKARSGAWAPDYAARIEFCR